MKKRLKYLTSVVLILSGVMMTVISAVMNSYLVTENNDKIKSLHDQAESIEQTIMQLWQDYQLFELKKDTAILLVAQETPQKYLINFISDVLNTINVAIPPKIEDNSEQLYTLFLKGVAQYKQHTTDQINRIYGEKLDFLTQARELEQKNNDLSNIALFFQIMGLILVLSKHFFD
ncbi:hypothetical protein H0A36_01555 [Endozoicomonas sp. SM1973]|uniref:Chemotaxis methyl-accepting receptor HlyB-like 4HB MCP domain-containing protein n=1 Tax=Spartinivicinus marinus TaxID=2994442 RepID=A0A853HTS1_9GAMM|nr:hypothetical protein [Spartinivicinus marinus]MCX4030082.1 hypothetical protein [Spartinivicinus marinus]NYZ64673.1 hypothetical protein [Spartinivicinus marinus]